MTKTYIDSRFRTANSKSESDFNVELPRSFNVPDGVVAHIDDIVIPVSWNVIDDRNNKAYISLVVWELKKCMKQHLLIRTMMGLVSQPRYQIS